ASQWRTGCPPSLRTPRSPLFPYPTLFRSDGVSLSVGKGDFVGILGHNGSGKSTLAKQLTALLHPTDGTVFVKRMDTSKPENIIRSEEHTSELQSRFDLVCRLLLENKHNEQ